MPSNTTLPSSDPLDDRALLRYGRQILLPEIDIAGQLALGRARVLMVGAGGLGCPVAQYLAAAGVGRLTLCDGDRVELSNLQRQILYGEADIGRPKVEAARARLLAQNPGIRIRAEARTADADWLRDEMEGHDLVLDCTDNFAARHAINAACQRARRPLISAAAVRWEGQLAVFDFRAGDAPCYACLYPAMAGGDEDTCSRNGVLGPLLGVLGSMQAVEAIRMLAGGVSPLAGRLLVVDAKTWQWRTLALRRDPQCPVCA